MIRRLIVVAAVVATALLLLVLQNKVFVGTQELNAEIRKLGGSSAVEVVFKDAAGVPLNDPSIELRDQVERRLKGNQNLGEIKVTSVTFNDAEKKVIVEPAEGVNEVDLRTRINARPFKRANPPRDLVALTPGIDLRGGVEFVCRLYNDEGRVVAADEEVLTILRQRLDERGLTEPTVTKLSNGDLQVVIPGGTRADAARTRRVLESTGRLEFREVLPAYRDNRPASGESNRPAHQIITTLGTPDAKLVAKPGGSGQYLPAPGQDEIYLGRGEIILAQEPDKEKGEEVPHVFYRLSRPALVGSDVRDAHRTVSNGKDAVGIEFTAAGGAKNSEFTHRVKADGDAGRGTGFIAISFDNIVKSAPIIISPSGNQCEISGQFTPEEIENLRSALRGGSLAVTPVVLSERVVGATLGQETISKGLSAMLWSFVAIIVFMFYFYRLRLGLVANLGLAMAGILVVAVLSIFQATITLPGLAGLVLTIGMAVDTNILVFERIREELKLDKGLKASIEAGYDRAFLTIIDAHLTTFLTALILYLVGTGPVKGFGLTLMIGIIVNLFSGVYLGRLLTDWLLRKVESVNMSDVLHRPSWMAPYVELRRFGYAFSIITSVLGVAWFAFGHHVKGGGFDRNFDIDFTGGNMVQVIFDQELKGEEVESIVTKAHAGDPKLNLIEPSELRKQPYFAEFGLGGASRQWVFRAPDPEGTRLEHERAEIDVQRGRLQRQVDDLRTAKVPNEAEARKIEKEQLAPIVEQLKAKTEAISSRTEEFKRQLGIAFAGKLANDGDEILATAWQDRTLTMTLRTLEPIGDGAAGEIADRYRKKGEFEAVTVKSGEGTSLVAAITYRAQPLPRDKFEGDAVAHRIRNLLQAAGSVSEAELNAQATVATDAYVDLVNVAAGQKVTIARPFPSSEHFSGQVADQMKWLALVATILAFIVILAYVAIRFEFRFGIGAVLALVHDVTITVGIISMLGVKIDLTVIAAILTIIGYSINDTIVTFDRIRENLRKNGSDGVTRTLSEIIDRSIAQTMPRTILTTGTVFITVVILLLLGGEALHAFSLTLTIGILSGTYSSVFVASPLLLSFKGKLMDPPAPTPEGGAPASAAPAST